MFTKTDEGMRNIMKKRIGVTLLSGCLIMSMLMPANVDVMQAAKVNIKSVKAKTPYAKNAYIAKGKKIKLSVKVSVKPNKSANKKVIFRSTKKKIATVNSKGVVKAKKVGTTKIIITSKKNKRKKATIKVRVMKNAVKKVTLNQINTALQVGQTTALKVTAIAKKGASKRVYWKSSDATVAAVTQKGVVRAVKPGTAKITVEALDGSKKKASCMVTVANSSDVNLQMPTETPSSSSQPDVPVGSAQPNAPEEPEQSQEPQVPSGTTQPTVTNSPQVTAVPDETTNPDATDAPQGTNEPESTSKPISTNKPEATSLPTSVPTEAPLRIESIEILNSQRVSFTLNNARQLTAEDIIVKVGEVQTNYQNQLTLSEVKSADLIHYQVEFSASKTLWSVGKFMQISIAGEPEAVIETQYVLRGIEYEDTFVYSGMVGSAIITPWKISFSNAIGSCSYTIGELPKGLNAQSGDDGTEIVGNPEESGVFVVDYCATDEIGNTFVAKLHIAIGEEDKLYATVPEKTTELVYAGSGASAGCDIAVQGGSGSYEFAFVGENHGLSVSSRGRISGFLKGLGDYEFTISISDANDANLTTEVTYRVHVVGALTLTVNVVDGDGNPIECVVYGTTYEADEDESSYWAPTANGDGSYTMKVSSGLCQVWVEHKATGTIVFLPKQLIDKDTTLPTITMPLFQVVLENEESLIYEDTVWYDETDNKVGTGTSFHVLPGSYVFHAMPYETDFLEPTYQFAEFTVKDKGITVNVRNEDREADIDTVTVGRHEIETFNYHLTVVKFVPEESGTYRVYSDSQNDTIGVLMDSNAEQLEYDDDSGSGYDFMYEYDMTAGEIYYIGVRCDQNGTSVTDIPMPIVIEKVLE